MMSCSICQETSDNKIYVVREMQLGLRESFTYSLCGNCNTLQLRNPPASLDTYYPYRDYYAFSGKRSLFSWIISNASFHRKGLSYHLLKQIFSLDYGLVSIGRLNPKYESSILDVGSGGGSTLISLKGLGFKDLTGIDPFLDNERTEPIRIFKSTLEEFQSDKSFDIIMFHHSLEHVPDPLKTLKAAKNLLKDHGTILIRTPVVTYAFEKYGSNWFQIDAPRHFFIYSLTGIEALAKTAGLKVIDTYYDSTDAQFFWSKKYQQDISMKDYKHNLKARLRRRIYSPHLKQVVKLNRDRKGDQAVFYMQKN